MKIGQTFTHASGACGQVKGYVSPRTGKFRALLDSGEVRYIKAHECRAGRPRPKARTLLRLAKVSALTGVSVAELRKRAARAGVSLDAALEGVLP